MTARRNPAPLQAALLVAAIAWLVPLGIVILGALHPASGAFTLAPKGLTLSNFTEVIQSTNLPRLFLNSLIVTAVSTALVIAVSSLAAYGLVRHPFPGSQVVQFIILTGLMLAPAAVIVPLYTEIKDLGLLNNYLGLIGPYTALGLPVGLLLFRNAFTAIPSEIFDAARVDGSPTLRTFTRVAMPLALPTIATVAILQAVTSWNEYLMALLFMTDDSKQTVQLAFVSFTGQFSTQQEKQFAVMTLVMLPVVIAFVVSQRWLIRGLTGGSVNR
jgi:ABC-type glycerol-3-phosphate transport system permease component